MTRKIAVVNDYDGLYGRFWSNLGEIVRPYTQFLEDPKSFDLLCFTGGEDVSPELYGHKNLASGNSVARDTHERLFFAAAMQNGVPMTGICRGAQLLNVLLGGTMVQHLRTDHGGGRHKCHTFDGQAFMVTSSHHQMIVPGNGGEVLAWAEEHLGYEDCVYDGTLPGSVLTDAGKMIVGDDYPLVRVTEAIAYPKYKVFAVQNHPEWQSLSENGPQWALQKIREICFGERKIMEAGA